MDLTIQVVEIEVSPGQYIGEHLVYILLPETNEGADLYFIKPANELRIVYGGRCFVVTTDLVARLVSELDAKEGA